MKLTIGENIRNFRKKNDLTQEALAERLGVTYQSVSRWENGTTYPDLELIPIISEVLAVSIDELLGMPQIVKEKRALKTFDALRRECMKSDYDADVIVSLLQDIRRNYVNSDSAWRPWIEGNERVYRDPKILPEVRLLAKAYPDRHPMHAQIVTTMAVIESEENIEEFLKQYATPFDCSAGALLFDRYLLRGDGERFHPQRRYRLYEAFNTLLCPRYLLKWSANQYEHDSVDAFMETVLSLIRRDAVDDRPDIWIEDRMELGLKSALRLISSDKQEEALVEIEKVIKLLEDTMRITEEVRLPTSCRFLEGMDWWAKEDWHNLSNNPDAPKERIIYIHTSINGTITCYCIFPSVTFNTLQEKDFKPLRGNSKFQNLCERVKALIVTKPM